jgi:hypothetical protein
VPSPIDVLFDHTEGEDWYWGEAAKKIEETIPHNDPRSFDVITSSLDQLPELMRRHSAWQIATSFEFLFNNVLSSYPFLFADERIAEPYRVRTVRKLFKLFDLFFRNAVTCNDGPVHLQREFVGDPVQGYVNTVCYMFWDNCPLTDLGLPSIRDACRDVMEQCLTIPNHAIIESALHGLGHLAPGDTRAAEIALSYSRRGTGPQELLAYAKAASEGHVQ